MDENKKKVVVITVVVVAMAVLVLSIIRTGFGGGGQPTQVDYVKTPPPDAANVGGPAASADRI